MILHFTQIWSNNTMSQASNSAKDLFLANSHVDI